MSKSNLKVVQNDKLPQLTRNEQKVLVEKLANLVCQDDDAVEILLLFAVQLQEHCHDWCYLDGLGMLLAQTLSTETLDWYVALRNHVEDKRASLTNMIEGSAQ
jgi:hypothetical protein